MGVVVAIAPLILWILPQVFHPKPIFLPYQNPSKGITIKYPENWKLQKEDGSLDGEITSISTNQNPANTCDLKIYINIKDFTGNPQSLYELKRDSIQDIKSIKSNSEVMEDSKSQTFLSNFPAYKLTYTNQEEQCKYKVMEIGAVRYSKAYYITYKAEVTEYYKYLSLAEDMINSFEIREESNLAPTPTK